MIEVWIIATRQKETYGHGSYGESWKLPTTGPYDSGLPHPAFPSERAAKAYIAEQANHYGLQPLRLEFRA